MELSDQQWAEVWSASLAKAMHLTRGDIDGAQDLAALVMEKLLTRDDDVPANLIGYVRAMTQNAYLDERSRQRAAFRGGGSSLKHPMDESIFGVEGVVMQALVAESPSAEYIRNERRALQIALCRQILAALPERHRELLSLAATGATHAQIAEQLGYASAQVVTQTLRRLYLKIREDLDVGPGDVLYSPSR